MAYEIAVAIIIIGFTFFLALLTKMLDDSHTHIKIFFFVISFFCMMLGIWYARVLASDNGASESILSLLDTAYWTYAIICIIVMFYIFIYYLVKLFEYFKLKKEHEKEWTDF